MAQVVAAGLLSKRPRIRSSSQYQWKYAQAYVPKLGDHGFPYPHKNNNNSMIKQNRYTSLRPALES